MYRKSITTIFLLSLSIRFAYVRHALDDPRLAVANDSHLYLRLAEDLAQGRFPSIFRTPGYPLFLMLTGWPATYSFITPLLTQMIIDSFSAVFVAAIAWRIWRDRRCSLLAGLIYAICPVTAAMSGYILSETLSIFLILAAFLASLSQPSVTAAVLQAVCWSAAALTRPFTVLLPLIIGAFTLIWAKKNTRGWNRMWWSQLTATAIYLCCILGWTAWNYQRSGMAVFSTNPIVSFYIYEIPALKLVDELSWSGYLRTALFHPKEFDRSIIDNGKEFARRMFPNSSPAYDDLWFTIENPDEIRMIGAEASREARGRLSDLVGIHLTGIIQTLRPRWASAKLPTRLLDILRISLLAFAMLWLFLMRRWWLFAFTTAWIIYVTALPGPCGAWRFRSLAEPIISICIAYAATWKRERETREINENREFPGPMSLCVSLISRLSRSLPSRSLFNSKSLIAPVLLIGACLPLTMTIPITWAVLIYLTACGIFASIICLSIGLSIIPFLRFVLLASFWFRMEINLFAIFRNHEEPPGLNISLTLLICLLLFFAWLMGRSNDREKERIGILSPAASLTLVTLLVWCGVTVAYGADRRLGIYALWSAAVSIFICVVVAAQFSSHKALKLGLISMSALIAFSSTLGIIQSIFPGLANIGIGGIVDEDTVTILGEEVSRVRALTGNSNSFGWMIVAALPMVIAPLLLNHRIFSRWQKALFLYSIATAVIALILSYSRGSWVAFALSLLLMTALALLNSKREERRLLIIRFAWAAASIAILAAPFSSEILSRFSDDDRGSAETRLAMVQVAGAMIADNMLMGVGLNNYESAMGRYDDTTAFVTQHFDWPVHNVYLHIAAETGVPGLLLFVLLTSLAVLSGLKVIRDPGADPMLRAIALGLVTGMAANLVIGMKEGSCFQSGQMRIYFLLCGLLFATEKVGSRNTLNQTTKHWYSTGSGSDRVNSRERSR